MKIRYKNISYQELVDHFGEEHLKTEAHASPAEYCCVWLIKLNETDYELRWLSTGILNILCETSAVSSFYEKYSSFKSKVFMKWNEKDQEYEQYEL